MSRKKLTKQHLSAYADWLAELNKEQLAALKVQYGISRPKFTAVVEQKQERGETAA